MAVKEQKPIYALLTFSLSLAGVYCLLVLFLYLRQDSLLFYPLASDPRALERLEGSGVEFEREGVMLRGWFIKAPSPDAETIVYYGGNGEEMSRSAAPLTAIGDFNYLLVNYRGYGGSEGRPGEDALKADAIFVLTTMAERGELSLDRTHVIGRSLGSGIAIHVAAEENIRSLILVSPYDSIEAMASSIYPLFPVRLLIRHPFRALDDAPLVGARTLIIKAARDNVIPHERSDRLIEAWPGQPRIATLAGTDHNFIFTSEFYDLVGEFLAGR